MKVAVTGGSGQLGTLVLRRLIDDREVKGVLDLDLVPPILVAGKLKFQEADVRDQSLLSELLQGYDALVHLAFVVTGKLARARFDDINVEGSKSVFRAAVAAGIRRMVYSSSIAAYGVVPGHPEPLVEDTPRVFQDDFPYAAAKYRVEEFLDEFEAEHPDASVARIRPSILIGERHGNPLTRFLGQGMERGVFVAAADDPIPIVWDEDVADAIVLALKKGARGAFNTSADEPLAPDDLAAATGLVRRRPSGVLLGIADLLARLGVGEEVDPSWQRQHGARLVQSSARAKEELGWQPRCPTAKDVIRRYLEVAPGKLDRRVGVFLRLTDWSARRAPPAPGASGTVGPANLHLTGKGGGDFTLKIEDGRLSVTPGAARPPASAATMSVATWFDLLAARTSLTTAQMTGKVRLDGDPSAGFVLGALLTRFRQASKDVDQAGRLRRALHGWFQGKETS